MRGHIIYNFEFGVWASLDGTYLAGGRTIVNGVKGDNEQANTRAGLTLALPVDRNNSIKLNASSDGQHDDVANAACGALASVISSSRYLENLLDPYGWLGDGGPVANSRHQSLFSVGGVEINRHCLCST